MFTIQYEAVNGESRMEEVNTFSRTRLLVHLASYPHTVLAVYERAVPITKTMRKALREQWRGSLSKAARDFIGS